MMTQAGKDSEALARACPELDAREHRALLLEQWTRTPREMALLLESRADVPGVRLADLARWTAVRS